jgi:hypothetical protein
MADGAFFAHVRFALAFRGVKDGPILNARSGANANGALVSAHDHARPDRRFLTNLHIADECRLRVDKGVRRQCRLKLFEPFDGHGSGIYRSAGRLPSMKAPSVDCHLGAPDVPSGMARFQPLSRNGHFEITEVISQEGGASTRYLVCDVEVPPDLRPLETGAQPPVAALPLLLAADDHSALRTLMTEGTATAPARREAGFTVWRSQDRGWERRLKETLEHVLIRPLCHLPANERVRVALAPLSEPGMRFAPLHRGLSGMPHFDEDKFLTIVAEYARVHELDVPWTHPQGLESARAQLNAMAPGHHAVLLVLPEGRGKILRFRLGLDLHQIRAMPRSPTLRSLDLTLLNALVFQTVLGLTEPETLPHRCVKAVDSLELLLQNVQRGELQAGFGLNPVPLWEVRAVMEAQQDLPPLTMRVIPPPPRDSWGDG